jgi:ribosomal 50S subunit-recycling heat shock protein
LEWEIELDAYQKAQWVNVEDRLEVEYKNPDVEVHVVELVGEAAVEAVAEKQKENPRLLPKSSTKNWIII